MAIGGGGGRFTVSCAYITMAHPANMKPFIKTISGFLLLQTVGGAVVSGPPLKWQAEEAEYFLGSEFRFAEAEIVNMQVR